MVQITTTTTTTEAPTTTASAAPDNLKELLEKKEAKLSEELKSVCFLPKE